ASGDGQCLCWRVGDGEFVAYLTAKPPISFVGLDRYDPWRKSNQQQLEITKMPIERRHRLVRTYQSLIRTLTCARPPPIPTKPMISTIIESIPPRPLGNGTSVQ